jgi:D-arabinose 1-dehydrogenase-like Zn-dependent alcohol dehydrogenase
MGGARAILATVTSGAAMTAVLGGLGVDGVLEVVGAPPDPIQVPAYAGLILHRSSVAGWASGRPIDSEDTMRFAMQTGIRPMTEVFPLDRAPEAYDRMMSGKARFRVVLTM